MHFALVEEAGDLVRDLSVTRFTHAFADNLGLVRPDVLGAEGWLTFEDMLSAAEFAIYFATDSTIEFAHVEFKGSLALHAVRDALRRQPFVRLLGLVVRVDPNEVLEIRREDR